MHFGTCGIVLVLACMTPGCSVAPTQSSAANAPPATQAPPPAPGLDAAASLPAGFIVSTNEPSWQVRVDGAERERRERLRAREDKVVECEKDLAERENLLIIMRQVRAKWARDQRECFRLLFSSLCLRNDQFEMKVSK